VVPDFGSLPTYTENIWYWSMVNWLAASLAVQETDKGASVMVAPFTVTGWGNAPLTTSAVQPGTGFTRTDVNGVAVGRSTLIFVVVADFDSLGTLKVTCVEAPSAGASGVTVTWAEAAPRPKVIRVAVAAPTAATLRECGVLVFMGRSFAGYRFTKEAMGRRMNE
jgi:hypothetical protein